MKQKILLSISILLFIILSNISIQLISQPETMTGNGPSLMIGINK